MFLTIGLIVVLACSFFFFAKNNGFDFVDVFKGIFRSSLRNDSLISSKKSTENPTTPGLHPKVDTLPFSRDTDFTPDAPDVSAKPIQLQDKTFSANQTDIQQNDPQLSKSQADQQVSGDPYQKRVDELTAFYHHLDQQPYMQEFHLKEPSKIHFSKLLQILIDNPPAITRETDDYFILLKNTAHFFRILGKDNMLVLKGILDREKDSLENILKIFYTLTEHPEYLKKEFSLTIPQDNLLDYAGFFLNTIGGRLYLFRRDSASRMTVSYYAILILDKANRQGNNRLGIDLRPSIDSLIEEIENAGKNLKYKEEYLDTLYDLKENYGNRG
ncbi:MAG: hypothetical protein V2B20_17205 [Pseudomonadota bacterium]